MQSSTTRVFTLTIIVFGEVDSWDMICADQFWLTDEKYRIMRNFLDELGGVLQHLNIGRQLFRALNLLNP